MFLGLRFVTRGVAIFRRAGYAGNEHPLTGCFFVYKIEEMVVFDIVNFEEMEPRACNFEESVV